MQSSVQVMWKDGFTYSATVTEIFYEEFKRRRGLNECSSLLEADKKVKEVKLSHVECDKLLSQSSGSSECHPLTGSTVTDLSSDAESLIDKELGNWEESSQVQYQTQEKQLSGSFHPSALSKASNTDLSQYATGCVTGNEALRDCQHHVLPEPLVDARNENKIAFWRKMSMPCT